MIPKYILINAVYSVLIQSLICSKLTGFLSNTIIGGCLVLLLAFSSKYLTLSLTIAFAARCFNVGICVVVVFGMTAGLLKLIVNIFRRPFVPTILAYLMLQAQAYLALEAQATVSATYQLVAVQSFLINYLCSFLYQCSRQKCLTNKLVAWNYSCPCYFSYY